MTSSQIVIIVCCFGILASIAGFEKKAKDEKLIIMAKNMQKQQAVVDSTIKAVITDSIRAEISRLTTDEIISHGMTEHLKIISINSSVVASVCYSKK